MSNEPTPLEQILAQHPIEPEDVVSWLQHPVTKVFMESIKVEQDCCDKEVHYRLGTQNHEDALQANGGFKTLERILEIPQDIIDELKEREPDATNT